MTSWTAAAETPLAAAATAAMPATTTAATTTRPFFAGSGNVYSQIAPVHIGAIERADGFLGLFLGAHRNKGESPRPPGGAIHHQIRFDNRAVRGEGILEIVFCGIEGEVSDKQFIIHAVIFFNLFFRIARGFRECSRVGFRIITEHCSRNDLPPLESNE